MPEIDMMPATWLDGRESPVHSARCPPALPPATQIFRGRTPAARANASVNMDLAAATQSSPQAGHGCSGDARR